jgi:hypothetical protein
MQNDYEMKVFESPAIRRLTLDLLEELIENRQDGSAFRGDEPELAIKRQAVRVTESLIAKLNLFRYLSAEYGDRHTLFL